MSTRPSGPEDRLTGYDAFRWFETMAAAIAVHESHLLAGIATSEEVNVELAGLTPERLGEYFVRQRRELAFQTCLLLVATAEGVLRTDIDSRRDRLARELKARSRKRKGRRLDFDEDILEAWKSHVPACAAGIGGFRGALRLRHWLAHGRCGTPKLGRTYDPWSVRDMATRMFAAMPGVVGWGLAPSSPR